jgi:transposase
MRAYSLDLRTRIVETVAAGQSKSAVAHRFGVGRATVYRYLARQQLTGSLAPGRAPGARRRLPAAAEPALRAQLATRPDATLAEHCATWAQQQGVHVSPATMRRAIRRLGWTRKKRRFTPASKTRPPGRPGIRRPPRATGSVYTSSTRAAPKFP